MAFDELLARVTHAEKQDTHGAVAAVVHGVGVRSLTT
jgi:hypothetical protein